MHEAIKDIKENQIIIWALKDNPYTKVYEHLGGQLKGEKVLHLHGETYQEVSYLFDRRTFIKTTSSLDDSK